MAPFAPRGDHPHTWIFFSLQNLTIFSCCHATFISTWTKIHQSFITKGSIYLLFLNKVSVCLLSCSLMTDYPMYNLLSYIVCSWSSPASPLPCLYFYVWKNRHFIRQFQTVGSKENMCTWLTAGGMLANWRSWESFAELKLLTPIDFANPNLEHSSMASQTCFISKWSTSSPLRLKKFALFFILIGQCIRYISTYSNPSLLQREREREIITWKLQFM